MSYVSSYYHCVFSTKDRRPMITPEFRERLWPFLGGIARENKMTALVVGGTTDHVHMLITLPAVLSFAEAMKQIKGGSSMWVHQTFPEQRLFSWQEKYGAFTVSRSVLDTVIDYIKNQEEHHRKRSFKEEFLALLRKHEVQYKEEYLWE